MSAGEVQQWTVGYLYELAVLLLPALVIAWLYRRRTAGWPGLAAGPYPWLVQFAQGAALGVIAIGLSVLPAWLGGGYSPGAGYMPFAYGAAATAGASGARIWLLFTVQSLTEELLFRGLGLMLLGMLLCWLARLVLLPAPLRAAPQSAVARMWHKRNWLVSGMSATAVVCVGFSWVHGHNPGISPFALANIALAGLALGLLYWQQGTPLGAWGLHLVWNAGLATLGLPVSGIAFTPPLAAIGFEGARPGLLTGGGFGPEAGLPACIAMLLVSAYLLWAMWRSADASGPPAARGEPPAAINGSGTGTAAP